MPPGSQLAGPPSRATPLSAVQPTLQGPTVGTRGALPRCPPLLRPRKLLWHLIKFPSVPASSSSIFYSHSHLSSLNAPQPRPTPLRTPARGSRALGIFDRAAGGWAAETRDDGGIPKGSGASASARQASASPGVALGGSEAGLSVGQGAAALPRALATPSACGPIAAFLRRTWPERGPRPPGVSSYYRNDSSQPGHVAACGDA